MDNMGIDPRRAVRQAGQTAREAGNSQGVHNLARLGYAAKGVVYVILGGLAAAAALGRGGEITDQRGVMQAIYQHSLGKILLAAVALGLVGYVIWCVVRATLDPDREGSQPKGLALRAGYFLSGLAYAGLALAAINLVLGAGGTTTSSEQNVQDWTARLLNTPVGVPLVVLAGLVALGMGLAQFYIAYKIQFMEYLEVNSAAHPAVEWLGRTGHVARGIVLGIIGIFLIQAALRHNPNEAKGLGGALDQLARTPFGPSLLVVVALGLITYGLFSLAEARFRIINRKV